MKQFKKRPGILADLLSISMAAASFSTVPVFARDFQNTVSEDTHQMAEMETNAESITVFPRTNGQIQAITIRNRDFEQLQNITEQMPASLEVTDERGTVRSVSVTWECHEEMGESEGYYYQFDPVPEEGYRFDENADNLPYVAVTVRSFMEPSADAGTWSSPASVTSNANEQTVFNFLRNTLGLNTAAACGVMANIHDESGFNPQALNRNDTGGTQSYGLCQWNSGAGAGNRYGQLQSWCSANGYSYTSLTGQLNFMKHELESNSYYRYSTLKTQIPDTAEGAAQASRLWSVFYEGCAASRYEPRMNLARNSYWTAYAPAAPQDQIPPVISDVKVTDVSQSGYTISCTVVDNTGVDRVQFPTWTVANGQDDLDQNWTGSSFSSGTKNGNRWSFRVNTGDHNSERGYYVTDIYAYDETGNHETWTSLIYIRNTDSKSEIGTEPLAQMDWNGHRYMVLKPCIHDSQGLNWMEASTCCQSLGGYLATVTSPEENRKIAELLSQASEPSGWIGLNDFGNEGHFILENGETSSYSSWSEGEPNNYLGSQDGVAISQSGKWDDNSNVRLAFILEIEGMCEHDFVTEQITANCLERTKTRKTCTKCGLEEVTETDPDWSEWMIGEPGEDLNGMKNQVETAIQYRTKGVRTVETEDANLTGYISREPFIACSGWSGWSDWSLDPVGANDLREVETTALYRYYYFYCPVCGGHEPLTGTSDCHQYSLSQADAHEGWFPVAYVNSNPQNYSYTTAKKYTESLGDGQRWNFSSGNLNDNAIGTKDAGSDAIVIRTGYRSRTRTAVQKYRYTFWEDDWSEWTTAPAKASNKLQVETRNVYRVDHAKHGDHSWNEGRIILEPTAEHAGVKEYECQTCHSIRQEPIPQLPAKKSIDHAQIVFDADRFEWTGKPITPHFSVIMDGKTLIPAQDYTWSFTQNVDPGNAQLTVNGIGSYSGICTGTFSIYMPQEEKPDTAETITMHRLYNPNSGEHFYTANLNEKEYLVKCGWKDEGVAWIAPKTSNAPVYRLYNANAGDHHYTLNAREREVLIGLGWKDEGTGWYSASESGVPLYRQYNPNAQAGSHNYTTSKKENDYLKSVGWHEEGIGWYGLAQ